ncbi:MAG: ParB/RepB/Spo0J family partition protein [Ruminococcaceae bacterium]|nr:ParB/RepB/Spo0J family partition protein [Oscillospiraceae bacterium]
MAKKNSLGRGLDSLFLENDEPDTGSVSMLRVSDIEPNPLQPRKTFDNEALGQLADSISRHGLLQPIAVRTNECGFYRIIAGERRWRAAKMAGLIEIPAIIYDMDDKKAAELALIENLQREDLNPIEEALAFRALIDDYDMTQEECAGQIGKSRSAVANSLRLLDLPDAVVTMVADGDLSAGHARAILSLIKEEDKLALAQRVVEKSLSVRDTEAAAKALNAAAKAEAEAQSAAPAPDDHAARMAQSYLRALEQRVTENLGRKFRILDAQDGKQKKIEITYENSDDLEALLKLLCGDTFFENNI